MELLQLQQKNVTSTAKMTYVLCPLRKSKFGIGKMTSITHCSECTCFEGLVTYENNSTLPKMACTGGNNRALKMLQIYTTCKKHGRSINANKFCNRKKCSFFKGVETSTGRLNCESVCPKAKVVTILPHKIPKPNFFFPIPCPNNNALTEISSCVLCPYFKGIYGKSKICCEHYKAVKSQYVVTRNRHKVAPPRKTKAISLQFLFQEFKPSKAIPLQVNCILHKTFEECAQCVEYRGVGSEGVTSNLRVNCAIFRTPIVFVKCPHTNTSVTIPTCSKCAQFQGFKGSKETCNTKVLCSFTKIQGYVNKVPKKAKVQHFYYDFPD